MKIIGWVHRMRLSCGCTLLDWQTPDGACGGHLRRLVDGEWRPMMMFGLTKILTPGARFDGRVFSYCPTCHVPWTDPKPATVVDDQVHAMTDEDRLPDGTYFGDLCCASRTCPTGWFGRQGLAEQKVEQHELFGGKG